MIHFRHGCLKAIIFWIGTMKSNVINSVILDFRYFKVEMPAVLLAMVYSPPAEQPVLLLPSYRLVSITYSFVPLF